MSGYMIFLENRADAPDKLEDYLKLVGLEDHLPGAEVGVVAAQDSPTGHPGKLLIWKAKGDNQHRIDKEKQEFIHNKKYNYHVVIWKDSPPTEQELRRVKTQGGKFVKFGEEPNDTLWKIATPSQIDSRIHFEDDESVRFIPIKKYAWFVDECEKFREGMIHIEGDSIKYRWMVQDAAALVLKSLRINYRLTPEVVNYINLFTGNNVNTAFHEIMGLDAKEG